MFLRVGLQAENSVLDRMRYHFSGLKGVTMADYSPSVQCSYNWLPIQTTYIVDKIANAEMSRLAPPILSLVRMEQVIRTNDTILAFGCRKR